METDRFALEIVIDSAYWLYPSAGKVLQDDIQVMKWEGKLF